MAELRKRWEHGRTRSLHLVDRIKYEDDFLVRVAEEPLQINRQSIEAVYSVVVLDFVPQP